MQEDVINVMSYLCSRIKVKAANTVGDDKAVWLSMGGLEKIHLVPSEVKTNCS